jgi:hypothetical protein
VSRRLTGAVLGGLVLALAAAILPGSARAQTPVPGPNPGAIVAGGVLGGNLQIFPLAKPPLAFRQSEQSSCIGVQVCFDEYASTPGPGGMLVANTNDSEQPSGAPSAFRRVAFIFRLDRDPATGRWLPVLAANSNPWCLWSNCVVWMATDDPLALYRYIWWGATMDNHNHYLKTGAGAFSR